MPVGEDGVCWQTLLAAAWRQESAIPSHLRQQLLRRGRLLLQQRRELVQLLLHPVHRGIRLLQTGGALQQAGPCRGQLGALGGGQGGVEGEEVQV
jgi:hypothetical protein